MVICLVSYIKLKNNDFLEINYDLMKLYAKKLLMNKKLLIYAYYVKRHPIFI